MVTATNKHTGEVVSLIVNNQQQLVQAWLIAQEYNKVSEKLKAQLKELVPKFVESNLSEPIDGYQFRISNIQRKNYDKTVMREVLDADTFDLLLKPDKTAIDTYLKENLESLGDVSTRLREAMIDEGAGYTVIKLERLDREVK